MKKLMYTFMLMLVAFTTFAQTPLKTKAYYLQKSKNQNTAGWVLLAGGTTLAIIGGASFNTSYNEPGNYGKTDASGLLMLVGITADLISIPLFISSAGNARKAARVEFDYQPVNVFQPGLAVKFQPAIKFTFKI